MKFNNLVIAAGPWSQRVLSILFPASEISIPFQLAHAAGNHLRVAAPYWKPEDDNLGCQQLYLSGVLGSPLDISSFLGGTLYVGGYGAASEELPEFAHEVHAQPDAIVAMKNLCERVLNLPETEEVTVISAGRCYRPVLTIGRPIIAKLPLEQLLAGRKVPKNIAGAFYLNTGHGSDGITLGPGSGKVMSDLIYGRKPTINISGLGMP